MPFIILEVQRIPNLLHKLCMHLELILFFSFEQEMVLNNKYLGLWPLFLNNNV
jgi:hypothetical protein